jgi:hypothetical protein
VVARFSAPVQNGPGAHPASYTMGNGFLSRGVKRPGRGVNHPPTSSTEVKERVELHLYSPSGPPWLYQGELYLHLTCKHGYYRICTHLTLSCLYKNASPLTLGLPSGIFRGSQLFSKFHKFRRFKFTKITVS